VTPDTQPQPPLAPGRGLDRRALIGVGAGLVLGAGLNQAGDAVAASSPSEARQPPSPGEMLMSEHGVLKRLLLVYQTASEQLAAGRTPPAAAIAGSAELIRDYIEGFHEGLEEAYVFPRVQPVHPTTIHTLLVQHDRGRHLTAAISIVAGQSLKEPATRAALHRYLDLFVAMYSRHEAWEDTVVFPTIREVMRPRTFDELAERFRYLEHAQYGDSGFAHLLDRVGGIERQNGHRRAGRVHPAGDQSPVRLSLRPTQPLQYQFYTASIALMRLCAVPHNRPPQAGTDRLEQRYERACGGDRRRRSDGDDVGG